MWMHRRLWIAPQASAAERQSAPSRVVLPPKAQDGARHAGMAFACRLCVVRDTSRLRLQDKVTQYRCYLLDDAGKKQFTADSDDEARSIAVDHCREHRAMTASHCGAAGGR
jgi:hypothetical protein